MSEERPRRIPRFFSCLIKGPLGCLAFLVGALVVLVLFLPPALGRLTDRSLESWFARHHAGTLELGDAWLGSLYGEQRVESLILRDPNGDEVLRGSLRAPELGETISALVAREPVRYGPLELHVNSLRLVEHGDGSLNLERAWGARAEAAPDTDRGERGLRTDVPMTVDVVVRIDRLRLVDRTGVETLLADLDFNGTLDWSQEELRLVLEGGTAPERTEALRARLELARPESRSSTEWRVAWSAHGLPSLLAEHLCPVRLPLARFSGQVLDEFSASRRGAEVSVHLEDQGLSFVLEGRCETDGQILVAREGAAAELRAPLAEPALTAFLSTLLPFARELHAEGDASLSRARLANFRFPLDGDWSQLSGDLELALGRVGFELDPALATRLGEGTPLRPASGELARSLRLVRGVAEFVDLRLPLEDGWLAIDGRYDLASQRYAMTASAEVAGARHDLGPWVGTRAELVPELPAPEPAPVPVSESPEAR